MSAAARPARTNVNIGGASQYGDGSFLLVAGRHY